MIRETELKHYGVLGMKWGHRKNDTYNKNYTSTQRKYDRAMYGVKAEKRINRKMNNGHNIQSARHYEVKRRDRNNAIKKGVKTVASILGTTAAAFAVDQTLYNGEGTAWVRAGAQYLRYSRIL